MSFYPELFFRGVKASQRAVTILLIVGYSLVAVNTVIPLGFLAYGPGTMVSQFE